MRRMVIEIPDELADELEAFPLPLPATHYCYRALAEAAARAEELRLHDHTLISQIMASLPDTAPHPTLLTFAQAAEELQVSLSTLKRLVDDDTLPVVKLLGQTVRIPYEAVAALARTRAEPISRPGPGSKRS